MPGSAVETAFDRLAPEYDGLWTNSMVGRLQRDAVWRAIGPWVRAGGRVLDLGCGTGEDAAWLMRLGARVTGIDVSPEMVKRARARGVDARVLAIEETGQLGEQFDMVLSNFGALNCVADWRCLAKLMQPGGYAVLCVLGRFCLWETAWYLFRGQPRKAARRWTDSDRRSSIGVRVFYRGTREVRRMFGGGFRLVSVRGIGVCVPPSYIRGIPREALRILDRTDRVISRVPVIRSWGDHRLMVFQRAK
jgi:SAM-dependent methyltransferase